MPIKGVIFDVDGTLLDTIGDLAYCVNTVLSRHNFDEHPVEAYTQFIGDGVEVLLQRATGGSVPVDEITSLVQEFKQEYAKNWSRSTRIYDGIVDCLQWLSHNNIKISVFSNKSHEFTVKMVEHFFPDIPFCVILGLQESIPRKPDPKGAIMIADSMGINLHDIAMIGDSVTDIQIAQNCGMYSIAVSWGYRPLEVIKRHNPDAIAYNPSDIIEIIKAVH